jgi:hypothetical protein
MKENLLTSTTSVEQTTIKGLGKQIFQILIPDELYKEYINDLIARMEHSSC